VVRPGRPLRIPVMRWQLLPGRIVAAGLVVWMGWIHLHLYNHGYSHIHDIGPLFLANFVSALVVAVALLVTPSRLLPLAGLAAAGLAAGTLAGLLISVNYGLFGFRDSLSAPFAHLSLVVEVLSIAAGLALSVGSWLVARPARAAHT
jgi:hypothetical protein